MEENKIIRKCAACNCLKSRNKLIRITINKNKEIRVMPDSKFFGRSLYICKSEDCVKNVFKKGRIFKILKIKPDEKLEEKIRAVLEN